MGLKPMFNIGAITRQINQFAEERIKEQVLKLSFLGEEFINKARVGGNYMDRTGNLRSSIGYIIIHNGEILNKNFPNPSPKGTDTQNRVDELINEAKSLFNEGLFLVVFAGMEYALYVEKNGKAVLSIFAPSESELLNKLAS